MTDLISRADAIEAIKKEIQDFEANYMHGEDDEEYGHDIGFVAGLHRAKTFIRSLPSSEDDWIPCSERLPNVGEDVLFCDSEWTQEGCLREDGDWWQFRWSTVRKKEVVAAWMPLPKPYKGGDAEQTELPQYEEWQDLFNKMCESAKPKTFVADEWYHNTFKEED